MAAHAQQITADARLLSSGCQLRVDGRAGGVQRLLVEREGRCGNSRHAWQQRGLWLGEHRAKVWLRSGEVSRTQVPQRKIELRQLAR